MLRGKIALNDSASLEEALRKCSGYDVAMLRAISSCIIINFRLFKRLGQPCSETLKIFLVAPANSETKPILPVQTSSPKRLE